MSDRAALGHMHGPRSRRINRATQATYTILNILTVPHDAAGRLCRVRAHDGVPLHHHWCAEQFSASNRPAHKHCQPQSDR